MSSLNVPVAGGEGFRASVWEPFVPKSIVCWREGYGRQFFLNDVLAGLTVGVIALPLAIAFGIASHVTPQQGLYTAIIAGFLISARGGSRVQIGGPTGAFVVIIAGVMDKFGYGGLAVRYSVFGNLPVYGTFGMVLGGGAVNLHRDYGWDDEEGWDHGWDDDDEWERGHFDPFLVVQPEVTLNASLTRWMRIGATVGYRFTGGVGRFGLGASDLNGIVAGGNVQLGWF